MFSVVSNYATLPPFGSKNHLKSVTFGAESQLEAAIWSVDLDSSLNALLVQSRLLSTWSSKHFWLRGISEKFHLTPFGSPLLSNKIGDVNTPLTGQTPCFVGPQKKLSRGETTTRPTTTQRWESLGSKTKLLLLQPANTAYLITTGSTVVSFAILTRHGEY